jgi:hypothetical protein
MSKERDIDEMLRLTRRELLRYGAFGAGMLMSGGLASRAFAAQAMPKPSGKGKAAAVIQIWLWGGASHLDTFDPKPGAGSDYSGPLTSPIKTNADGMIIGELLPEMAKQADKFSIIRSLTHGSNAHETASYMVQTGFKSGDNIVHPGIGAVATLFKGYDAGYKGLIPPYIVLTQLLGRFSESGFLGFKAAPFATGGDPNQARFAVEGVVAEGITDERQRNRRELLQRLDTLRAELKGEPEIEVYSKAEAQAYDLILGDAGKVFDLSTEKDDVRTKYGRNTFGQSCLMARRLVAQGVPFVTINYGGWDSHKQNFQTMRRKVPELDKGVASLLQELSERGLLDSTVVWVGTEFGRTPRVQWEEPWGGGRSHYGPVFSHVIAGGGFKGGHVVGSSDATGEEVRDRPVYPNDLLASIYELIDIDPASPIPHPQGLSVRAVPAAWEGGQSKGRLSEIM